MTQRVEPSHHDVSPDDGGDDVNTSDDDSYYNSDDYDHNIDDEDEDEDEDYESSSSTPRAPPLTSFPLFPSLPPELRAQIWRTAAAVASCPGINFFNLHAFPGDHPGVNRSDSPPWLYLDVRRLSTRDSDEQAARYDPSVWQARAAVRQTCSEARDACAIPAEKRATVVLTRPRRGLFVRAGDGQLRWLTPFAAAAASAEGEEQGQGVGDGENPPSNPAASIAAGGPSPSPMRHEPKVTRSVEVHVDDVICLALENCSFNMWHEELSETNRPPEAMGIISTNTVAAAAATATYDLGWSYDPQLTPLPGGGRVSRNRFCVSMSWEYAVDHAIRIVPGMLAEIPDDDDDDEREEEIAQRRRRTPWLTMIDPYRTHMDEDTIAERARAPASKEMYRDRFGDVYVTLIGSRSKKHPESVQPARLAKVMPMHSAMHSAIHREYHRSAQLPSPKRPVSLSR